MARLRNGLFWLLWLPVAGCGSNAVIPHLVDSSNVREGAASYRVSVPLVEGRLPTRRELLDLCRSLEAPPGIRVAVEIRLAGPADVGRPPIARVVHDPVKHVAGEFEATLYAAGVPPQWKRLVTDDYRGG